MTAAEISDLVREWPIDARPGRIASVDDRAFSQAGMCYFCDKDGNAIDTDTVAHAFVGSGLAWLWSLGNQPALGRMDALGEVFIVTNGHTTINYHSPLEAVSAAILATK